MEYTIYSITCQNVDVSGVYVGSTKSIVRRKLAHKYDSKKEIKAHLKLYKVINENGGISNWEFKILESFTCEKQTEAFIKERLWYDHLEADLNTYRPYTTIEECKDKFLEYQKQWYIADKEKIKQQCSEKIYCESCDCYHNKRNKARHNRSSNHINNLANVTE